ncbi:MAG: ATP synthase F0 subunit B [Archangium gephyra]|uniref:ATP synthase subunit b n=1 Tax=Archangium gephyra TaxID=48 RepID=A0A2W5T332_9BACT|nr:MAG: ATP synthase F0 subunit B [Archangium gephyra]
MNFLLLANNAFTDVKPGLIIWTWITFIIVAIILRKFAWGPLLSAVEGREKNITNAIESAKRERAEAEKLLAEQKTAIAAARQEAADAVRKTQADMEKFREELMSKARKEADSLKDDATRAIAEERTRAIAEIKGEAVKLSIAIAEKLLSEKLDDAKHQQLAQQFVTDLGKKQTPVA